MKIQIENYLTTAWNSFLEMHPECPVSAAQAKSYIPEELDLEALDIIPIFLSWVVDTDGLGSDRWYAEISKNCCCLGVFHAAAQLNGKKQFRIIPRSIQSTDDLYDETFSALGFSYDPDCCDSCTVDEDDCDPDTCEKVAQYNAFIADMTEAFLPSILGLTKCGTLSDEEKYAFYASCYLFGIPYYMYWEKKDQYER